MMARAATPPTVPPAIAPTLVDEAGAGVLLCDGLETGAGDVEGVAWGEADDDVVALARVIVPLSEMKKPFPLAQHCVATSLMVVFSVPQQNEPLSHCLTWASVWLDIGVLLSGSTQN